MRKFWFWCFVVLCFVSVVLFCLFNFVFFNQSQNKIIKKYANHYKLDEALVFAIVKNESGFNQKAVSGSGAKGLMQIMPKTARWIASELGEVYFDDILFDPEINVKFGCFYLSYLFEKFEYEDVVICAYNAGEGKVLDWLDDDGKLDKSLIDYAETKAYLERVQASKDIYK